MTIASIKIGTTVRDPFGREGVVCAKEISPPESWINEQLKSHEIRKLGHVTWWGVIVFGGGYVLWPEPMLTYLRPTSYDDFVAAADTANPSGREKLAIALPHHVDRLLEERRNRELGRDR